MTAIELSERIENGELTIAKFYEREAGFQPGLTENKKATAEALRLIKIGERQQWIPVSERLPDKSPFLAFDEKYRSYSPIFICAYDPRYGKEFYDWQTEEDFYPTHWMPLPELPKEDIDGQKIFR